jgi:hypothetical protein
MFSINIFPIFGAVLAVSLASKLEKILIKGKKYVQLQCRVANKSRKLQNILPKKRYEQKK